MDIRKLFTGVALVIDDNVNSEDSKDGIIKIAAALQDDKIPLVKYSSIPDSQAVEHFSNLNFIILDWEFGELVDFGGMPVQGTKNEIKNNVINFIKIITEKFFIPIFIFTNQNIDGVKGEMRGNGFSDDDIQKMPILFKNKSDFTGDGVSAKIFSAIDKWLSANTSVYVLKEWNKAFVEAEYGLFRDFSFSSSHWPKILWENFTEDTVDPNNEISELLLTNILSRMGQVKFDENKINMDDVGSTPEELLEVLKHQRFFSIDNKEKEDYMSITGDFYNFPKGNNLTDIFEFAINIRPACDCIVRQKDNEPAIENNAYLLKCEEINDAYNDFNDNCGNFNERSNEVILGPLFKGKFYKIFLKHVYVKDYEKIKSFKVGRVLHPFITHLTEKFALYIHRQGMPRIPIGVFPTDKRQKISKDELRRENVKLQHKIQQLSDEKESLMRTEFEVKNCHAIISYKKKTRKFK